MAEFDLFEDVDDDGLDARRTQEVLVDTTERMGVLLDMMPTGFLIHQVHGILFANREAIKMLGLSGNELVGQHVLDFVSDNGRYSLMSQFFSMFDDDTPLRRDDIQVDGRDGSKHIVRFTASRLPWPGVPVAQVLLQDVTELKEKEEMLKRLSLTDPLTGAYNRRHFTERAKEEVDRARRYKIPLSVLVIDIDHFKNINDTYGHAAGDEALKVMVSACKDSLRLTDKIAILEAPKNQPADASSPLTGSEGLHRLGGEEFAVLLPHTPLQNAREVAERLRLNLSKRVVCHEAHRFSMTGSFGVATFQENDTSIDTILQRADEAVYRAKQGGRNRVEVG